MAQSRLAVVLQACLLLSTLLAFAPSAEARLCLPEETIRVFLEHASPLTRSASASGCAPGTSPDPQYQVGVSCDGYAGLWFSGFGVSSHLCVRQLDGLETCAVETLTVVGVLLTAQACTEDNDSGDLCLASYLSGAAYLYDRTCLDKNEQGRACLSHYADGRAEARLCTEHDGNGGECPTLYVDGQRIDRVCYVDYNDGGHQCASNYVLDGSTNGRACLDRDDQGHECPSIYSNGQRVNRACNDTNEGGYSCASDYAFDGSTSARLCLDRDETNHECPSVYSNGQRVDRACVDEADPGSTCVSNYWADGSIQARACHDNDGRTDHPCATVYANGARRDRACAKPEGDPTNPDVLCASNTADTVGRVTGCADPSTDGEPGHACASLLLDGGEVNRACNDPEPGLTVCASDHVLGGYASDRTCVGSYPEGLCVSHAVAAAGVSAEGRVCSTTDEHGNACVSATTYVGGSPAGQVRSCPNAAYPEGSPCVANGAWAAGHSAEARSCSATHPETGKPCVQTVVLSDVAPVGPHRACEPVRGECGSDEVGIVLDGQRHCQPHPCPPPEAQLGTPGESLVVVCGRPVPDLCPLESIDLTNVAACGQGPLCDGGVQPGSGNVLVYVCGDPTDNPCPPGTVDPEEAAACGKGPLCPGGIDGDPRPEDLVAVCDRHVESPCGEEILRTGGEPGRLVTVCGHPVDDPCDEEVVGEGGPGELATVCGTPVPCPYGLDPMTVSACVLEPACPSGVAAVGGVEGPLAYVCGEPVDPCPGAVTLPPGYLVVVCGIPVDEPDPCPGSVDPWRVAACGVVQPQCPQGLYALDTNGRPVRLCTQPVPQACPDPLTFPPGYLAAVCGIPVDEPDPCPGSVDPWYVKACGIVSPQCPEGLYALDGNGRPTRLCTQTVPQACPDPVTFPPGYVAAVCGIPVEEPDPCPGLVQSGGPGQLVVVCGIVVPCEHGIDAMTGRACVREPVCPSGTVVPGSPEGPLAYACGTPVNPCPGLVTFPPGPLVAVCGVPLDPCPGTVDPWTLAVCGLVGPVCPAGLYEADGGGVPTAACGQAPCDGGIGPGPLGQPTFTVCGRTVPNPVAAYARDCMDGLDNDGDGRTDYAPTTLGGGGDTACTSAFDDDERA